jgi:hypothetical protein
VAVPSQRQALVEMGAGFLVGGVEDVEAGGHEVELVDEAVLLLFE